MWMHEALRGVWWHENIQKGVPWEDMGIIRLSHCFLPVLLFTVWFRCWTMLHVVDRQDRIFNRKWMKMVFAVCNPQQKNDSTSTWSIINLHLSSSVPVSPCHWPRKAILSTTPSNGPSNAVSLGLGAIGHGEKPTTSGGETHPSKQSEADPIGFSKKGCDFQFR